jgi:hypothetical protein
MSVNTKCVHCGQVYDIEPADIGCTATCEACGKDFIIRLLPTAPPPLPPPLPPMPPPIPKILEARCDHCGLIYEIDSTEIGTEGECEGCEKKFTYKQYVPFVPPPIPDVANPRRNRDFRIVSEVRPFIRLIFRSERRKVDMMLDLIVFDKINKIAYLTGFEKGRYIRTDIEKINGEVVQDGEESLDIDDWLLGVTNFQYDVDILVSTLRNQ